MKRVFTLQFLQCMFVVLFFLPLNAWAQSAEETARTYLTNNKTSFNLTDTDIANLLVKNQYTSAKSGITHVYFIQSYEGIEVFNAIINVNVMRDGSILNAGNRAISNLGVAVKSTQASLTATQAVEAAASSLGLTLSEPLSILEPTSSEPSQAVVLSTGGISLEPIPAKLVYQPLENGDVRLAWDVSIYLLDAQNWWSMRVDAATGDVLNKIDWVSKCVFDAPGDTHNSHKHTSPLASPSKATKLRETRSMAMNSTSAFGSQYRVFAAPFESPGHGERSLVNGEEVIDRTASPYGWHDVDGVSGHDFNIARGNNAHAYYDGNNLNAPAPTLTPEDGGLDDAKGTNHVFDFPADLNDDPLLYREAAITNLFYWNNLIHDVFYQYGFDEVSGNFQQNNYSKGGFDADYVFAEAQDGSGANNANFATPPDGRNPRMQMFLWTGEPRRDGDFDNGVIVHEYGHGISIRLTGGPSTSGCLSNEEQMGEGWSDWFALMMTMEAGDTGPDRRGIGTYVLYEDTNGNGIRPAPYSTDMGINNYTYKDIAGLRAPHGVGFVWSTMLWEVTWGLIEKHGFNPDLYNGTGGNNIALELVTLALKLQPCSPGFIDGRDAIIKADSVLYGGANYETIYTAFAKRGLGYSASQGSSASKTDGVEAYNMPTVDLLMSVDNASIGTGGTLTYSLTAINRSVQPLTEVHISNPLPEGTSFISASDGGTLSNGVVNFPAADLAVGQSIVRTFQVRVNNSPFTTTLSIDSLEDDLSNGTNWARAGTGPNVWQIDTTNSFSGSKAWFVKDEETITDQYLSKSFTLDGSHNNHLSFWHEYDTEANYDGGVVEISTDGGVNWSDLGNLMVKNSYNSGLAGPILGRVPASTLTNRRAFSGQSGDYLNTIIDLSDYNGQTVSIRWRLGTDVLVGGVGWWVDDVAMLDAVGIQNEACVTTGEGYSACTNLGRLGTIVFEDDIPEPIELASFEATGKNRHIALEWITAAESNNDGFELQRRTEEGSFQPIAWIDSKGESRSNIRYKYNDKEVLAGTLYFYRLRQVDIHGEERFSHEVSARIDERTPSERAPDDIDAFTAPSVRFNVYPNPASQSLMLSIQNEEQEPLEVQIVNLQGQQVYLRQFTKESAKEIIQLNTGGWENGIYILKVVSPSATQAKKFIISK